MFIACKFANEDERTHCQRKKRDIVLPFRSQDASLLGSTEPFKNTKNVKVFWKSTLATSFMIKEDTLAILVPATAVFAAITY